MGRVIKASPERTAPDRPAQVLTWLGKLKDYIHMSGDGPDSYAGILVEEIEDALRRALAGDPNDYLLPVAIVGRPYARRRREHSYGIVGGDTDAV